MGMMFSLGVMVNYRHYASWKTECSEAPPSPLGVLQKIDTSVLFSGILLAVAFFKVGQPKDMANALTIA